MGMADPNDVALVKHVSRAADSAELFPEPNEIQAAKGTAYELINGTIYNKVILEQATAEAASSGTLDLDGAKRLWAAIEEDCAVQPKKAVEVNLKTLTYFVKQHKPDIVVRTFLQESVKLFRSIAKQRAQLDREIAKHQAQLEANSSAKTVPRSPRRRSSSSTQPSNSSEVREVADQNRTIPQGKMETARSYTYYNDGSSTMGFGMHREDSYQYVVDEHPSYADWCSNQDKPSRHMEDFVQWCMRGSRRGSRVEICRDTVSHKLLLPMRKLRQDSKYQKLQ